MTEIKHDELTALVDDILKISQQAGEKILDIYETNFSVSNKDDNSPLTAADVAAHKTICAGLTQLTPDTPILSEESAEVSFETRKQWKQYWLVDPLDGTREFIKRNGEFSVNIALIENHKSIMGVIHIPVKKESYTATLNNGSYKYDETNNKNKITIKQTDSRNITIAGSRSHANPKLKSFINRLDEAEVLSIGSSLKFCLVAEGKADIYPRFGPTSEWDTAAAQCIVEEAGGLVVDTAFKPLMYNTKDSLLNPAFIVIADQNFDWKPYLKDL